MSEMSEPIFVTREARLNAESIPDDSDDRSNTSHLTAGSRDGVDFGSEGTGSPRSMR